MYRLLYESHEAPASFEIMIPSNHKDIKLNLNDSVVIELDNNEIVVGFVEKVDNDMIKVDHRKITRAEIVNVIKVPPRNVERKLSSIDKEIIRQMIK